jgi:predicted membrane-bound spermidine synthase
LFFVSGFCGLLYQVVWTRLAFASFGITMPVLSVVISVFMLGLALGSWAAGRFVGGWVSKGVLSAVQLYAVAEAIIGVSAFMVPGLFKLGARLLSQAGAMDSFRYLSMSAFVLAISILPWCVAMGATFPLMMAYVRERIPQTSDSFSYLYLANVVGAMTGTLLTAFILVELLGFRDTLWVAAAGNFAIAVVSVRLGSARAVSSSGTPRSPSPRPSPQGEGEPAAAAVSIELGIPSPWREGRGDGDRSVPLPTELRKNEDHASGRGGRRFIEWLLFTTGFCAMAMEVVWTRAFAPVVKTQVYSFALVLATYLGATYLGSLLYRRSLENRSRPTRSQLIFLLCSSAFLPIIVNDAHWLEANWGSEASPMSVAVLLGSICPFCGILGFLTPNLVDEYSRGSPSAAGKAYAINVLGCILGPLVAAYLLLPYLTERFSQVVLGLPFCLFALLSRRELPKQQRWPLSIPIAAAIAWAALVSRSYEDVLVATEPHTETRRDYAASVISFEDEQSQKHLLVNGIGMTRLNPVTKFMAHLPLGFHRGRPESALVICFGMGTSYRSVLSWNIDTTAVELVPSVPKAFEFYHADAERCLQNPKGRIVIDDGRRFLERTREKFDVILLDPPPPVEAAGSSLLYAQEFYELAKKRLNTNGIVQAWFPGGEQAIFQAVLRSVTQAFPYVRCFSSLGKWGTHILASMEPIEPFNAEQLAARLPDAATQDLLEWSQNARASSYLDEVLRQEFPPENALSPNLAVRITDDRPFNEYFFIRRTFLGSAAKPPEQSASQ